MNSATNEEAQMDANEPQYTDDESRKINLKQEDLVSEGALKLFERVDCVINQNKAPILNQPVPTPLELLNTTINVAQQQLKDMQEQETSAQQQLKTITKGKNTIKDQVKELKGMRAASNMNLLTKLGVKMKAQQTLKNINFIKDIDEKSLQRLALLAFGNSFANFEPKAPIRERIKHRLKTPVTMVIDDDEPKPKIKGHGPKSAATNLDDMAEKNFESRKAEQEREKQIRQFERQAKYDARAKKAAKDRRKNDNDDDDDDPEYKASAPMKRQNKANDASTRDKHARLAKPPQAKSNLMEEDHEDSRSAGDDDEEEGIGGSGEMSEAHEEEAKNNDLLLNEAQDLRTNDMIPEQKFKDWKDVVETGTVAISSVIMKIPLRMAEKLGNLRDSYPLSKTIKGLTDLLNDTWDSAHPQPSKEAAQIWRGRVSEYLNSRPNPDPAQSHKNLPSLFEEELKQDLADYEERVAQRYQDEIVGLKTRIQTLEAEEQPEAANDSHHAQGSDPEESLAIPTEPKKEESQHLKGSKPPSQQTTSLNSPVHMTNEKKKKPLPPMKHGMQPDTAATGKGRSKKKGLESEVTDKIGNKDGPNTRNKAKGKSPPPKDATGKKKGSCSSTIYEVE
jgi:hypothetical protein